MKHHCSTAGFLQAGKSDLANGIGLERRSGLNPFGNVVVLAMEELEDSDFIDEEIMIYPSQRNAQKASAW